MSKIRQKVYQKILERIKEKTPFSVTSSFIGFADSKHEKIEGEREYIITQLETPRKTQTNILTRLLEYSGGLYLGIDSYKHLSINLLTKSKKYCRQKNLA